MTKEMYDYINKELNSHNFYDIKEDEDKIYLVWKGTDKVFATLEKDKIEKAMENENSK